MEEIFKEFNRLNSFQRLVVESDEKYIALKAAVGSGKTTVIINRILYLHFVKKVPLDNIMVVTFTNKSANEIKDRLKKFISEDISYIGTFHSIANKILREKIDLKSFGYNDQFKIISYQEAGEILNKIVVDCNFKVRYKSKLQKRIEEFKNGNILYANMKKEDEIEKVYEEYKRIKIEGNMMDYEDLIINCRDFLNVKLGISNIIIDEFQDTDYMQFELIKKIADKETNIFVVGDKNQTIYSFRTGTKDIFDRFINEFNAAVYDLPINYRSTKVITQAASSLIGERIYNEGEDGEKIKVTCHYDAFNEANYILKRIKSLKENGVKLNEIAVLYRRQVQGEVLYDVLSREVKCEFINGIDGELTKEDDTVKLLTLHSSKGLEFSHVFIIGVNEGNIPISNKREVEDEELRLFLLELLEPRRHWRLHILKTPLILDLKVIKVDIYP